MKEGIAERPRKRAKHTRSRLGCRVCRIRRIKCDITRPACEKCTSTGRTCEWYPPPTQDESCLPCIIRYSPTLSSSWDPQERRFLNCFRTNTVTHLTGTWVTDFWVTTILQISDTEPCIRYGILALGGLHEAFQEEHFSNSRLFPHKTALGHCAWLYYIKTIEQLNLYIHLESWKGVDIVLLCCILCAGFERLRGCYTTADTHLRNGKAILDRWLQSETDPNGSSDIVISTTSTRASLIRHHLLPVFSHLVSQARTFIAAPVPYTALLVSKQKLRPLPHLKAARDELYEVLGQSNADSHSLQSSRSSTAWTKEVNHARILNRLSAWFDTHNSSLADTSPDGVPLLISYILITIMVRTSLSNDQMQFDSFKEDFDRIVGLASVLSSCSTGDINSSLSIEVVPVLFFVSLKCRDPRIRRKAISLMRTCSTRELPWDPAASAGIAQEVVSIEEEGMEFVEDSSEIAACARVDRLFWWTEWCQKDSSIKFRRQGDRTWSGSRFITW